MQSAGRRIQSCKARAEHRHLKVARTKTAERAGLVGTPGGRAITLSQSKGTGVLGRASLLVASLKLSDQCDRLGSIYLGQEQECQLVDRMAPLLYASRVEWSTVVSTGMTACGFQQQ